MLLCNKTLSFSLSLFFSERLKVFFENALSSNTSKQLTEVYKAGYWLFCDLVGKINTASDTVGKDGKFQVFICVGIRFVILLYVRLVILTRTSQLERQVMHSDRWVKGNNRYKYSLSEVVSLVFTTVLA